MRTWVVHVCSSIFYRYAGNKASLRDVAGRFGVSESTCHKIISSVMGHLCGIAYRVIKFPSDIERLSLGFQEVCCCLPSI